MTEQRSEPFPIKKIEEDNWEIDMEGSKVNVSTKEEAELLASIPVELFKTYSSTEGSPDIDRIKEISKVCNTYGITSSAIRKLKALLKAKDG